MAEVPPPQYVAYPRASQPDCYGTVEQLQALSDAYFAMNWRFPLNILVALGLNMILGYSISAIGAAGWIMAFALSLLASEVLNYRIYQKVGFGKGWPSWGPRLATTLFALNTFFCFGLIVYVIMQNLALEEIKRYGVKSGFFGPNRRSVQEVVARRLPPQDAGPCDHEPKAALGSEAVRPNPTDA